MEPLQEVLKEIEIAILKRDELNTEINTLKEKAISLFPFKRGDKVIVTEDGYGDKPKEKETICFIGKASFRRGNLSKPFYEFNKIKKDGAMGNVSAAIYSYKSIRLFNS